MLIFLLPFIGSPPLTRGILYRTTRARQKRRFTPAHAGNTLNHLIHLMTSEVHPRSRGEYYRLTFSDSDYQGSPPLTRGILGRGMWNRFSARFTPAHAGNTTALNIICHTSGVHPRSRGEYNYLLNHLTDYLGSPPLTRGIQRAFQPCSCRHRFTPAHAGNTLESNPTVLQDRVHPRSRGEYILEGKYFCSRIGSPPLTRGILGSTVSSTSSMRFTPAHAGNTFCNHNWAPSV